MTYAPLAIKRRNILGDIYNRCDTVDSIPVYLNIKSEEPLGYADESLGHYADAFLFHLPENVCKQLSTGHFDYAFDFDYLDDKDKTNKKRRIKLNCILLVPRRLPSSAPKP
jgi:hypothetical protein